MINVGTAVISGHNRLTNYSRRKKYFSNNPYLFWIVLLLVFFVIPYSIPLVLLIAAILAPINSKWAAKALTISWLTTFLNPSLTNAVPGLFFLKFLLLICCFFRAVNIISSRGKISIEPLVLIIYGLLLISTAIVSDIPSLTILKGILFLIGSTTAVVLMIDIIDIDEFYEWFFAMGVVLILFSAPLLFSGLGYLRNGSGFQGVLSHPQAMGLFISIFTTIFAIEYIYPRIAKFKKITLPTLFLISVCFLILTQARVALLATIVALGATVLLSKGKIRAFMVLSVLVLLFSIFSLTSDAPTQIVSQFLLKSRVDMSGLTELYLDSRGEILARSIENFYSNIFTGIGFGIPSRLDHVQIVYDPVFGLPISAPVEKGFFIIASLEEAGLLITGILLFLLTLIGIRSVSGSSPISIALLINVLSLNFTESTIFSISGFGLLIWIIIGLTLRLSRHG